MTKLTERDFVLRAVTLGPNSNSGHFGIRRDSIEPAFRQYFGPETNLDEVLDALIRNNELVAVKLTWKTRPVDRHVHYWRATVDEAVRLRSFPDPLTEENKPLLYLPGRIPRNIRGRLTKIQSLLDKITAV